MIICFVVRNELKTKFINKGTNLTLQIVNQIAYQGSEQTTQRHIEDFVPWPESERLMPGFAPTFHEARYFQSPTGLLPIKTHLTFDAVPQEHVAKKILVIRDAKDSTVSMYHFMKTS